MKSEKFKISLLKNGIHSFNRGLDSLLTYNKSSNKDNFVLKESIIFLHNGIELLLKEVLMSKGGEYLIFSDLSSISIKKLIEAKRRNINVFNLHKPPHTATYLDVIDRVKAFVDFPEIELSLETRLKELNVLRNNIEHYGVDADRKKVEILLVNIHKPISEFFNNAGVDLGVELETNWKYIEKQLIIEASRLRGSGSIKTAKLIDYKAIIEYVDNYEEYKVLQPNSLVSEVLLDSYWSSGDAIIKAINDGSVRLLRNIDIINEVSISLPYKHHKYFINISRDSIEEFIGYNFDEVKNEWNETFSDRFVYNEQGRKRFFNTFGEILDLNALKKCK